MPATNSFTLTPMAHVLKLVVLAPLLTFSQQGLAVSLVGGVTPIDATTPLNTYELSRGAILNADGATTSQITARQDSAVNLSGSTVVPTGQTSGVTLINSTASITNNSTITSNGTGLSLGQDTSATTTVGSTAQVSDSQISGRLRGVLVSAFSTLNIERTTLTGSNANGVGISSFGGQISAKDSTIVGGLNGVQLRPEELSANNNLTLDGTRVEGLNGAAIAINGAAQTNAEKINIVVKNGSSLIGGNGAILEVNTGANAGFLVDNSTLVGDVIVDADSSANVALNNKASLTGNMVNVADVAMSNSASFTGNLVNSTNVVIDNQASFTGDLVNGANAVIDNSALFTGNMVNVANVVMDNNATFTGNLVNVSSLAVNNNAKWVMVGAGDVANLSMNGGVVQFGNPTEFYKLSVGSLTGAGGTFIMDADFATGQVDTLEVTGIATGNHKILMGSSGVDPTGAGTIPVVHIASGDAAFSLLNGPVDLGAYSYDLMKQGNNDWVLNTASRVISPGTQSVLALFNTAPTVWYGELSTLRTRMGEVRMDPGKAGGWLRAYGNKFDVSESSGVDYQQTQRGISFGADAPLPIEGGQWLVGLLGGYSKSDLDLGRGTSGTVNSYYVGAYTTWLNPQSGYYFDGVLKFNHFQNESDVRLSDGKKAKGDYDNNGVGASLEFGRHIALNDGYFVEPYGQLSGVVIQGKDYDLDNAMSAEGDRTRSLLGKLGTTAGRTFDLGEGKRVQPYIRAAYVHEFANNNEVEVNNNVFNNDLSGSRGEVGAGVAMTLTDKVSIHVDLDYSDGDKIKQPWGGNFGLRYLF